MAILDTKDYLTSLTMSSINSTKVRQADSSVITVNCPFLMPIGFDTAIYLPLLVLLSTSGGFYSHIRMWKDGNETEYISIPHTRSTDFIFKLLKPLGINLNELTIALVHNKNTGAYKLQTHSKIVGFIKMNDNAINLQLVQQLILIHTILKSLTHSKDTEDFTLDSSSGNEPFISGEMYGYLKATADEYAKFCNLLSDSGALEIVPLDENETYTNVQYILNRYTKLESTYGSRANKFAYNTLSPSADFSNSSLVFINVGIKPEPYMYILNKKSMTIYTNQPLIGFMVTDSLCFLYSFAQQFLTTCGDETKNISICINSRTSLKDLLATTSKKLYISSNAEGYEKLLENYAENAEENFNMSYFTDYTSAEIVTEANSLDHTAEYASDKYAQELFKQVLPYYKDFNLRELTPVVKGFSKGAIFSMLFVGESGTGKSTAARVIPSRCGIPYIIVNGSTNIEESDFIGTMIPNPTKLKPEDPEFIWKDGCLVTAMKKGYCIIFEEINFARPGILGKLNSLLDEARQIDLPTGEVVKASPNFRFIMTGNIGYEGTNRLNRALVNRVDVCKEFVDLDKKEAISVIKSRTGYENDTNLNAIYDVYTAIKKYSTEQNLGLVVSLRQLMNICKHGSFYKTAYDAVINEMVNQAFIEDVEHKDYFIKTVLPAFKLTFKM